MGCVGFADISGGELEPWVAQFRHSHDGGSIHDAIALLIRRCIDLAQLLIELLSTMDEPTCEQLVEKTTDGPML